MENRPYMEVNKMTDKVSTKEKIAVFCFVLAMVAACYFGRNSTDLCSEQKNIHSDKEEMMMWLCIK